MIASLKHTLRLRPIWRLLIIIIAPALLVFSTKLEAQSDHPTITNKDEAIEELLAKATKYERAQQWKKVAQTYLLAKKAIQEKRRKKPNLQIVTRVSETLDWGIERTISERIRQLPEAGKKAYLLAVEPRAKAYLQAIRPTDLEALTLLVQRFPFAPSAQQARQRLADFSLEMGQPIRAAQEFLEMSKNLADSAQVREALIAAKKCYEVIGDQDGITLVDNLALKRGFEWQVSKGTSKPEKVGREDKPISPIDISYVEASGELSEPEMTESIAKRFDTLPSFQQPVLSPNEREVYVADSKTIRSYKLVRDLEVNWNYTLATPNTEPERFEVSYWRPAVANELVVATINCNLPTKRVKKAAKKIAEEEAARKKQAEAKKKAKKKGFQTFDPDSHYEFKTRRNWRIVGCERATGIPKWVTFDDPKFVEFSRNAEWISSPVVYQNSILVSATLRSNSLKAFLIRLALDTGKVEYVSQIASKTPENHRALAVPLAPPVIDAGRVYVATSLGLVACMSASSGQLKWAQRYPVFSSNTQSNAVDQERRYEVNSPILVRKASAIIVAPVDGPYLMAFDRSSGEKLWQRPRLGGSYIELLDNSKILIVGENLVVIDAQTGLIDIEHNPAPIQSVAPPIVDRDRFGIVGKSGIHWFNSDLVELKKFNFLGEKGYGRFLRLPRERLLTVNGRNYTIYGSQSRFESQYNGPTNYDKLNETGKVFEHRVNFERAIHFYSLALKTNQAKKQPVLKFKALEAMVRCLHQKISRSSIDQQIAQYKDYGERLLKVIQLALDASLHPDVGDREFPVTAVEIWEQMASVLASADSKADAELAVKTFQRILNANSVVIEKDGILLDAKIYSIQQQKRLLAKYGPDIYSEIESIAQKLAKSAIALQSSPRMNRIINRFPLTEAAGSLRLEIARLKQRRFMHSDAEEMYLEFLEYCSDKDARIPAVLVELFNSYIKQRRPDAAARILRQINNDYGSGLEGQSESSLIAQKLVNDNKKLLTRFESHQQKRWKKSVTRLNGHLSPIYQLEWDLDGSSTLLLNPGPWFDGDSIFLWRYGKLESRKADGGFLNWSELDFPEPSQSRPLLGKGNTLFLSYPDRIEAKSSNNNELVWQYPVVNTAKADAVPILGDSPIYKVISDEKMLYVIDGWQTIHGIRASDGKLLWKHKSAGIINSTITASGKHVAIGLNNPAQVHVLNRDNGKLVHSLLVSKQLNSVLDRAPIFVGNKVMAISDSRFVSCFDLSTGQLSFTKSFYELPTIATVLKRPESSKVLLIGGKQANTPTSMVLLDTKTGLKSWVDDGQGKTGLFGRGSSVTKIVHIQIRGNSVFSVRQRSRRYEVWSQDASTGLLRWKWQMPLGNDPKKLVETPDSLILCYGSSLTSSRISIIEKGNGRGRQVLIVPGRKVLGVNATDGILFVLTERGQFAFTNIDHRKLKEDVVAIHDKLKTNPTDKSLLATLSDRLFTLGRVVPAIKILSEALLAENLTLDQYEMLFLKLNSLLEQQIEQRRPKQEIRKMTRPPEIDGILDDWWRNWTSIDLSGPEHVSPILGDGERVGIWRGNEDLSAKLYIGYDARNFYFALDVRDMDLRPFDSEAESWIGDSLIIAIDCKNNGGLWPSRDDMLLTLALTKPRKKGKDKKKNSDGQDSKDKKRPEGKYFVKRKEDRSGIIYECKLPWAMFEEYGVNIDKKNGPARGFTFGFNLLLTDDDGHSNRKGQPRGAVKALSWTPSLRLHHLRNRLWQGYMPEYFGKIQLK